jgi:carbamoyltransferase
MEFDGGYPVIGNVFSTKMIELLGEQRKKNDPVEQKHKDIACSLQQVYEEILFHMLKHLNQLYPDIKNLCLAGGCAQNSLANGKITSNTEFDSVWIQPAAGDAGGALGAALAVSVQQNNEERDYMNSPALGQRFSNDDIASVINNSDLKSFKHEIIENENKLVEKISDLLVEGKVIGFFHGGSEWGPRALGNRSIIVDPRIKNMKDLLNEKIKKRESFRPFAPSVLREEVANWFEKDEDVPFMTHVFKIIENKREIIPAVTHEDGTGRLQSVTHEFNPRYYRIIKSFFNKTGVPMILNTSFNENEPIVNTPQEALNCFLRTNMDVTVLENHIIER